MTEASNPQVLQGHIKEQLDIQAVQLEERFHQIVEEKLGQHSSDMESKLDEVVVMINNRIEGDAERDRALEDDRESTRAFQLMVSNFVAAAGGTPAPHATTMRITPTSHTFVETCPTVAMLPSNSDSDSDYEEESVSSSEANESMAASDDRSVGSSTSENSYDTAHDSQATLTGGHSCPISIHTDSTEDSSVEASI